MGTPGLSCIFGFSEKTSFIKPDVGQILATSGIAYQTVVNNHVTVAIMMVAR